MDGLARRTPNRAYRKALRYLFRGAVVTFRFPLYD